MNGLLDTHFLLWIILGSRRLRDYGWIDRYQPWGISPVSLFEIQFLAEADRLDVSNPEFTNTLMADKRFIVDEVPLVRLIREALPLGWTSDPFDRLLVAHSIARRVPLCTVDRSIRDHHRYLPGEIRV